MKQDRLFQIIYFLLDKKHTTAPELAAHFDVSIRTIYRDIDTLTLAGIPIYTTQGKHGGISIMPEFVLDKSLLSEIEQKEILFALQSLQATEQDYEHTLSKLTTIFQKPDTNWITVDFSRWGHRKLDTIKFEKIKKAILEKRLLQLSYANSYGEITYRKIQPFRLLFKSKYWYIQAYCLKAKDFRVFKMNRIITLSLLDTSFSTSFSEPPSFDTDILISEKTSTLQLKFSPHIAFRVYDEFSYECIEQQEDGSIIVTTAFIFDSWLYSYLLGFGTEVEILKPSYLKKDILKYLKKIEKHFKT